MEEFAPGIPISKEKSEIPFTQNEEWDFVLHRHKARRAGLHYDLRLSDGKKAYSWAVRKGLPEPGRKHLAIRQPDHIPSYMQFVGRIAPGKYGAGSVTISESGKTKAHQTTPKKIKFTILNKKDPENLVLVNTGRDNWQLINVTPTTKTHSDIKLEKRKYKEAQPSKINEFIEDDSYVFQPKIDGAHVILNLRKRKQPEIFSYRPSRRSNRLLNHTHKMRKLDEIIVPDDLDKTTIRAEITAVDNNGNTIPSNELSAILNASSENAIKAQDIIDVKLKTFLFDVDKYKNKPMQESHFQDKMDVLNKVNDFLVQNGIESEIPETKTTQEDKKKLYQDIEKGIKKETSEGVVAWNIADPKQSPIKIKIRPDYDVYVREIFKEKSETGREEMAGGFRYSITPKGKIIGNVGTGFDHDLKKDMIQNPRKFIGRAAKIRAMGQFPSGSLRAPSFSQWHLEKGKQASLNKAAFIVGFFENQKGKD